MPLPASGNPISLDQVNAELGIASATLISLNDAAVRSLFVKSSGEIAMSDGHGKSASSAPVVNSTPSTPSHICYYSDARNQHLSFNVSAGALPITVYLEIAPYNTCYWTYANNGSPIGTMTSLGWFSFMPANYHNANVNMAFRLYLVNSSGNLTTGGVGVVADDCTSETFCSQGNCVDQGQPGCYNCSEQCGCDPCTYDTNCDCSTGYGSHGCDASCDCDWCNNYYDENNNVNPDWPCPCSCQLCSHDCTCPCGESCPGGMSLETCESDFAGWYYGNTTSSC